MRFLSRRHAGDDKGAAQPPARRERGQPMHRTVTLISGYVTGVGYRHCAAPVYTISRGGGWPGSARGTYQGSTMVPGRRADPPFAWTNAMHEQHVTPIIWTSLLLI
jgi:hypothetical protein